jgi:hypothetical protein
MNTKTKRILLFIFGCMTSRFALAYTAYKNIALPILGIFALFIGLGFTTIYLGNLRPTGPEVFGEKIWWNALRPIHAFLYFMFAYLVFTNSKQHAWKPLLADALLGLTAFIIHHTM